MTPEWKLFINFCPNSAVSAFYPRFTCRGRIWGKSAVAKLRKSRLVLLTKKTRPGHFLAPILLPLSRLRPKFCEHCRPWPVHVYRLWSGSDAVCRTYSGKSQKSQYNIGFQPTIIRRLITRAMLEYTLYDQIWGAGSRQVGGSAMFKDGSED